jgi:ribose transport system permease protein
VGDEPRPGVADWFLARARGLTPLLTLTVLVAFFGLTSERFLDPDNLRNILVQVSPIAVAATGLTFVVLCAEIDLSFANIATMSGIVMAAVWVTERPMLAIPLALLAAIALGLLNGLFTARFAIPSFMVTLAMMQISEGVTIYVSKGKPYFRFPRCSSSSAAAGSDPCRSSCWSPGRCCSSGISYSPTRGSAATCT